MGSATMGAEVFTEVEDAMANTFFDSSGFCLFSISLSRGRYAVAGYDEPPMFYGGVCSEGVCLTYTGSASSSNSD